MPSFSRRVEQAFTISASVRFSFLSWFTVIIEFQATAKRIPQARTSNAMLAPVMPITSFCERLLICVLW